MPCIIVGCGCSSLANDCTCRGVTGVAGVGVGGALSASEFGVGATLGLFVELFFTGFLVGC